MFRLVNSANKNIVKLLEEQYGPIRETRKVKILNGSCFGLSLMYNLAAKKILKTLYAIIGINRETNKIHLPDTLISCLRLGYGLIEKIIYYISIN